MARKRPDHLRAVVNNSSAPAKPADQGGAVAGESPHRAAPPPLPPDCPVTPIGMGDGVRYYANASRQLVTLKIKDHTRLEMLGLFGEHLDQVYEIWPRRKFVEDENGNTKSILVGWDTRAAEEQLMRLSAAKGIWSPLEKARGRGCWRDERGGLVVNTGGAVLIDGQWQRPGLYGDYFMTAHEAIMKPALLSEPGGARGAGAEALALLATWPWKRPIDPVLKLGLIGCRFLGAALRLRPVEYNIGKRGTGKSTLQTAEADLMGGWLLNLLDPTPAAVRQLLGHDCIAVAVDEAEPDSDKENKRRLAEMIKLARLSYSGGRVPRGGSDGEPSEYVLRSAMLFSSIRLPPLTPQDRSRSIVLRLGRFSKGQAMPDLSRERLRPLGARLLRRVIDGYPRLAAAIEQYRLALCAVGHEGRSAEGFGTALAVADILQNDEPVDTDSAAELAKQLCFDTLAEAEDDREDEENWLAFLLSSRIPLDGTGPRNTVAGWLRQAVRLPDFLDRQHADGVLAQYGLKVIRPKGAGDPTQFAVANHGQGLEALHRETHWAGLPGAIGGWKQAARDLPDAEAAQKFRLLVRDLHVCLDSFHIEITREDEGADVINIGTLKPQPGAFGQMGHISRLLCVEEAQRSRLILFDGDFDGAFGGVQQSLGTRFGCTRTHTESFTASAVRLSGGANGRFSKSASDIAGYMLALVCRSISSQISGSRR